MGNWLGWNFGARGATRSGEGEYVTVEITVVGKIGNPEGADRHRATIEVYDKQGKHITSANSVGTLSELSTQAEGILSSGDRYLAQHRSERGHGGGERHTSGEWSDPTGMGGE